MFEVWERFDARGARSLINRHRKALRQEHAALRKLLHSNGNDTMATEVTERIDALRQAWLLAAKDLIQVCAALVDGFYVIKLANLLDVFVAQSRLSATCHEVSQTIQRLGATARDECKSGSPASMTRTAAMPETA
ncbi:MAG TPA: hypothetical protein VKY22_19370 [Bradyrhizobium sp.]|nr:hypothetical protein [Bradyrhizobium sp.]